MADLVCAFKDWVGSVCNGLPADNEYQGKQYCVLHCPSADKDLGAFTKAIDKKLGDKDFDFRSVFFPGIDFSEATFEGDADFSYHLPPPSRMRWGTIFVSGVKFSRAAFKGDVRFSGATFERRADFSEATFERDVDFRCAAFEGAANFFSATFKEEGKFRYLQMASPQPILFFWSTVIEKPERFSFHSIYLRPSWFIDVDPQKFDFSDVEWFELPNGARLKLEEEIEAVETLGQHRPPSSLRKLQKTCRQLMNNAEENRDYPTANEFHYWSMEAQRKEGWSQLGLIGTLYWALSGYGVRAARALWVLVAMWAAFTLLYVLVDPSEFNDFGRGISYLWQAAVYSLLALTRLSPEPKPEEPGTFQFFVGLEGILGPLQIALLALAIRRKVMR